MSWIRLTTQSRRSDRLVTLLFALSLLSMPVDYRGGAELPHAHALFQFWMTGDEDAFDHHGHGADRHEHEHGADHLDDPAAAGANIDPSPNTPAVSELGSEAERGSVIALTLLLVALFMAGSGVQLVSTGARRLVGQLPSPEPPPPRVSVSS
jgi:hypothetical protein